MIVSQPRPRFGLKKSIQGIIKHTKDNGCPENHWYTGDNLIGYTNIDWVDEEDRDSLKIDLNRVKKDESKKNIANEDSHGNSLHYYYNNEIKSFVYIIIIV